jgi:signal transduction histidine kinase
MGEMMRHTDWRRTELGPVARWPQSLRTAISMMLESRFAMVVAWGPQFRLFYNDRYRPILGDKHPALGRPLADVFPEVWDVVGPAFERVRRGEAFAIDDWLLPLNRSGYLESCWFTLSYSPIRDESGGVGGVLAVVAETTAKVLGERRLGTLRELAARAAAAATPHEACTSALAVLERNEADVPFAAIYVRGGIVDGPRDGVDGRPFAHRVCSAGVGEHEDEAMPPAIDLAAPPDERGWPIARVLASGRTELVRDLPARLGPLPRGLGRPEPAHTALLLPLTRPGASQPYGVLIAGVSPRHALDDRYRDFFELAADHLSTAIANARALDEQRRRAEALAEIDRAKTAFFSNVSHEFRTPLTLILGPLEDLIGGRLGPVPDAQRAQHAVIHRNALRMLKLVNSLLDVSRIEAGRMQAQLEPTDLAAMTTELASMFRAAAERAGLRLVVDCPPLPAPVHVDRGMWEKILLNLLSNALKFTFDGEICVRLRAAGDRVELEVSDTGCGIPPDELPHLFQRFHRVQGARSRSHEGTGIGLALAQELVRVHGGAIRVASTLGAGTVFTVSIPAGAARSPRDGTVDRIAAPPAVARTAAAAFLDEIDSWIPSGEAPAVPASPGVTGRRVVVADDNADLRAYLLRVLGAHWRVEGVADGEAALAAARRELPDLIITDVMMPGLDGFAVLRELRADERTRRVPVIMLSARAGEEARVEGLGAGADDYLVKPFSALELVARVQSLLTQRAAQAELTRTLQYNEMFAGMLGHDLRNPLNAILAAAQLLERRISVPELAKPLGRILNSGDRMARMIAQLLDFTRVRVGRGLELERAATDLAEVCAHAVDELGTAHPGTAIEIRAHGDLRGHWDNDRIAQVLSNLVGNAVQHGATGAPVVVTLADEGPAAVRITVENRGAIPDHVLPILFEPFRATQHRGERASGLGLGLYITREIIEAHGGEVRAQSDGELGTRIEIRLPRRDGSAGP